MLKRSLVVAVGVWVASWLLFGVAFGFEGKVTGVSDGDTIKVMNNGVQVKVRLYGIDTPEKSQAFGVKAKQFTQSMVAGKIVRVDVRDTDRYGRTVGMVFTQDEKCLNEEIVKAGFAWVYNQYCRQDFCPDWRDYQDSAMTEKIGLWADSNPMPPWDYRRGGKKMVAAQTSATGEFHGNVKSRVFHGPNCRNYNCKNCTEIFSSGNQAIQAGYHPCGQCNP